MRMPNLEILNQEHAVQPKNCFYGFRIHPNPYYYKFKWWLFWRGSPVDGARFLAYRDAMCTAEAMAWLAIYKARGETVWIYNTRYLRKDLARAPFDPKHPRWKKAMWTVNYDKDCDPTWRDTHGTLHK